MAQRKNAGPPGTIGDAAVRAKTGKTWAEWLRTLDQAKATSMTHQEIVALLREKHDLTHWWAQSVTVGYERARGLREKHQKPAGFEIGRSKTVGVPIERLYRAVRDVRTRRRWLDDPEFEVRKATPQKSIRITWVDGRSHVDAMFWAKGAGKSQIQLNHKKLRSRAEAERMKTYWGTQLDSLKSLLER